MICKKFCNKNRQMSIFCLTYIFDVVIIKSKEVKYEFC